MGGTNPTHTPMIETDSDIGCCPQCGREIPEPYVLIEYKTEAGDTGRWAECPECAEVVAPDADCD